MRVLTGQFWPTDTTSSQHRISSLKKREEHVILVSPSSSTSRGKRVLGGESGHFFERISQVANTTGSTRTGSDLFIFSLGMDHHLSHVRACALAKMKSRHPITTYQPKATTTRMR